MKKILLIQPPFNRLYKDNYSLDRYPLALGYLAGAVLKNTDWQVVCYNADFKPNGVELSFSYRIKTGFYNYLENLKDISKPVWQEVRKTLAKCNPDVVGISSKSQDFASSCIVAKLAKENNPNTIVVIGGAHPSLVGADCLKDPNIDICVRQEAEVAIVELLETLSGKKDLAGVKGIVYKKDGGVSETGLREFIQNLDVLEFPHKNAPQVLLDYDKYPKEAFGYIFATRGCPYNCFYCGSRNIWSRKVRFRSPENVIQEIKELQALGLRRVHFDDDTFGVTRQHISDLCAAITRDCPGLSWSCEAHVKLVDEEIISLMKKAGCRFIQIGIESGNNEILQKIRKEITKDDALDACRVIKKSGIILEAFFMIGFPWETESAINDTLSLMEEIDSDKLIYSIFTPYPGTEAFDFCKGLGLIGEKFDLAMYNHQSPENYFCPNISREKFRELLGRAEKLTDRVNSLNRINWIFSPKVFVKIRNLSIRESLRKARKIISEK